MVTLVLHPRIGSSVVVHCANELAAELLAKRCYDDVVTYAIAAGTNPDPLAFRTYKGGEFGISE